MVEYLYNVRKDTKYIMNHKGTQKIETERLVLRRFTLDDVQDAYEGWYSDPEVAMCMQWEVHTDIEQTKKFITEYFIESYENLNSYRWAIALNENNKCVGSVGLFVAVDYHSVADVAYALSKEYWNKGIISEALTAVIHYGLLEVGINRIEAFHAVSNPASGKVMQKAGMKYEGHARQKYKSQRGFEDSDLYAILREDLINK